MICGKKLHVMSYTNLGLPVRRELGPAHNKALTTLLCFVFCHKSQEASPGECIPILEGPALPILSIPIIKRGRSYGGDASEDLR